MEMKDAEVFDIEEDSDSKDGDEKKCRPIIRKAVDLQRLKLEKLMKNPEKPVVIPEQPRERDFLQSVPSFVRNVMGSSAGAGSGEFHVYRHLRRKEYARMKYIQSKSLREQLDEEFQAKLEKNRLDSEAKTAKKRAKRQKKKQKAKQRGKKPKVDNQNALTESVDDASSTEESENEEAENDKPDDNSVDEKRQGENDIENDKTEEINVGIPEKNVENLETHQEEVIDEKRQGENDKTVEKNVGISEKNVENAETHEENRDEKVESSTSDTPIIEAQENLKDVTEKECDETNKIADEAVKVADCDETTNAT